MKVEIDPQSGFCGGVIRAIGMAEKRLAQGGGLYSLGAIVHNEMELERLAQAGLQTIETDMLAEAPEGASMLIRAHGAPPPVYAHLRDLGYEIVDCTCPVVLRLQKDIRAAYERLHSQTPEGQLVIFGKIGHAEVMGLLGQVDGDAVVVENLDQISALTDGGVLCTDAPVELFSQTTMGPAAYASLIRYLEEKA